MDGVTTEDNISFENNLDIINKHNLLYYVHQGSRFVLPIWLAPGIT